MLQAAEINFDIGSKRILSDVSLKLEAGEMVALCGPNGAGKSTLLRILAGEQKPSSGTVHFRDRALSDWAPTQLARCRAKLSQESQLTFGFRVYEVIEMGRFPHDTPQRDPEIIQRCMRTVGIEDLEDRFYTSLSGGEKQRVHLARVLAQLDTPDDGPRLLFLDEPTSALDLLHQEVALKQAHALCREQKVGSVVVLHDLNLAAAWADRILLMKNGQIRHRGTPAEVLCTEVLREIYDIGVLVLRHPQTDRPIVTIDRDGG